ncbi:MAG: response regulator transcription factor [Phenylobacterium sp.]|uniref:response regulator transcription factor n=1 Tax=Phenylobacterium sp. TaxID=1871053 RepID=UPI001A362BE7|nr:response regulator transcription factor [Phenylobacterium sp.]MBL8771537.1 response regulator transcription factor [Phenylobacterium sp.]
MFILVVEDNASAVRSLELILKAEGHNLAVTASGEEAIELVELYDYDVVLLDLDLEDISGADVLREMRMRKVSTPVIMLTGAADVDSKVAALAAGADDYMTKPFHKAELAARLNAVVRRSRGHTESIIRTGAIALNMNTRTVEVKGAAIHLTPSEYKMLELLSLRKNSVLTKEQCLNHLYNGISEPEIKIIDVFICKLRKKIAAASGGDSQIETVWGGGYMLRDAKSERLAA